MNHALHIADNLSLPLDAVTQTFAILGIRGSGKTNTAVVMMEEMLKHSQQCVALDPTNAWYGIRSSRDGKSDGFKVYVFGGPNGDLPLEGTHGTIMADFVVETGASVVFSLRHLSMNDQRRFAMEFGERLHFLKGKPDNRTPLCLFLDEADEWVPQRIPKGYERMFGAYDRLVRRDRNCGLGVVLISQRPQVVNKDTLSQIETLICHRLLHKLDRKSVKEAWVEGHDIKGKAEEFFGALASLGRGDTWVWSPEWLDIFKRVHVRERETFDSSATPKAGERVRIAHRLAEVDLDALKQRLAGTIEKAKQDDPRELRKQIDALRRELLAKRAVAAQAVKNVEVKVPVKVADPVAIRKAVAERDRMWQASIRSYRSDLKKSVDEWTFNPPPVDVPDAGYAIKTTGGHLVEPVTPKTPAERVISRQRTNTSWADLGRQLSGTNGSGKLRAGAERMLSALAQWSPSGMRISQMRSHAGMKKSGTFTTYMSDLRKGGYIEERDGMVFATDAGMQYFGGNVPDAPRSTEEVLAVWEPKLRDGARRILRVLVEAGGNPVPLEELTERASMTKSGTFTTYLSDLRTARLIETGRGVAMANKETLFL